MPRTDTDRRGIPNNRSGTGSVESKRYKGGGGVLEEVAEALKCSWLVKAVGI
jgi:hypothetical protein